RACLVLLLWCVACSQRNPAGSTTSADDPTPPAPAVSDAGPAAAPAPDAGPAPIVADPPDASSRIPPAPPPAIPAARCEAAPQLLWAGRSRPRRRLSAAPRTAPATSTGL